MTINRAALGITIISLLSGTLGLFPGEPEAKACSAIISKLFIKSVSFMTEITSNTATTILFLPIIASFAITKDYNIILMSLPIVLTASCAFMMPIATPPNAIIYSNNSFKIFFMVKNGFFLNLMAIFQ